MRTFVFVALACAAMLALGHFMPAEASTLSHGVSMAMFAVPAALKPRAPRIALESTMLRPMPRAVMAAPRADVGDPKTMVAALQKAFDDFKAANDEKLKGKADVVLDEKVQRIDAAVDGFQKAIDELNAKIAAQAAGGSVIGDLPADPEYVKSFKAHMRKGAVEASMSKGADTDGGYLAPVEWDRTITGKLKLISPIRAHARVQTITVTGFKKLFTDRAVGSGWVGEEAERPETGTPKLAQLDFTPGEIYANPAITQGLLDDAALDLEQWLADEVDTEFARQEGIAFVSGNGTNKPFGILGYVTGGAAAARHPWGAIAVKNSGAAAAVTTDGLITLIYDLPSAYQGNAKFFANRLSVSAVRKLKDGQNNYIWQPSFQAGEPSTLLGQPLIDVPDMPNIAADAVPFLYGDMQATYLVVDRVGIRVLRDPYTNKPFVHFYTTKRVGGGVYNPEPMRALKIAA